MKPRCLFALLLFTAPVDACVVNIAYNVIESPPYYVGDGDKIPDNPGATIELINMAAQQIQCKIQWQRLPLKRILVDLERNVIDATLALSYSAERAAFATYPMKDGLPDARLSVWTLSYNFYARQGTTLKWDGKQFNRAAQGVGANSGYSINKDLAALGIATEEAPGELNNLRKLVANRIEVYAGQDVTVDPLREQPEFRDIEKLSPPIVSKDYFLVFSRDYGARSGKTVARLWKHIAELKSSRGKDLEKKYKPD